MKCRFFLYGALIASLGTASAQHGSLFDHKIYEGKEVKPTQATPAWSEFSVNGEGAKVTLNGEGALCAEIAEGTSFGYMCPLAAIGEMAFPYAVEYRVRVPQSDAGVDVDLRTPEGMQVSFTIQRHALVDRVTGSTVCQAMDNASWSVFRFVFEADQQTTIYKNGELLAVVPQQRKDVIADPGFEASASVDPMWWCSGWSQMGIDGASPYAGTKSLHWENGWTGQLGAQIPVQPNSRYRLTYWARAVRVNAPQTVMKGALWVGGMYQSSLDIPAGNYQQFSVEFSTGNTDERADLEFHNGWNDADAGAFSVYIDDMELVQIEGEPYVQFGKLGTSGASQFELSYVAAKTGESLTPIRFSELEEVVARARELREEAVLGNEIGNYPQYAFDRLHTAWTKALGVDQTSSYEAMDGAYAGLLREIMRFENCRITDAELEFARLEFRGFTEKIKFSERLKLLPEGEMNNGERIDSTLLQVMYASVTGKLSVEEDGSLLATQVGKDTLCMTAYYKNAVQLLKIPIEVEAYGIQNVEASTYEGVIRLGDATGIKTWVSMSDGKAPEEGTVSFRYESLNPEVAQVLSEGVVWARSSGVALIKVTADFMGQEVSAEVPVTVSTVDRIEWSVPDGMVAGTTAEYLLKAYDTSGNEMQLDQEDWVVYSDNNQVVRVNNQGVIFAKSLGEAVITARIRQASTVRKKEQTVAIGAVLSVAERPMEKECVIYHNRAKGKVCIEVGADSPFTAFSVFSPKGELMCTKEFLSDRVELNTKGFARGIYLIVLQGENLSAVKKVISF